MKDNNHNNGKKIIYLDSAATTKPTAQVIDDFVWASKNCWYNPSAIYQGGVEARTLIENARKICAESIGCSPEEIYFTSGGTESNNWALDASGTSSYCSILEHPSIFNNCYYSLFHVDEHGFIYKGGLYSIEEDDVVSIQLANNEIGTIQDIKSISEVVHDANAILHVDAVQAYMHIPINVKKLGIDMMSISGHKFGALKGTGFLYVNKDINFEPMLLGGHQEMNMRAGTENVAGIYAMGNRIKYIMEHGYNVVHVANITRKLSKAIYEKCGDLCEIIANGAEDTKWRLPNNLSLTFRGINAEALLIMLSEQGVYCSAGSACSAGLPEPSRVLKAIGLSDEDAKSTLRFTVTEDLTDEDIDYVADTLKKCIELLKI